MTKLLLAAQVLTVAQSLIRLYELKQKEADSISTCLAILTAFSFGLVCLQWKQSRATKSMLLALIAVQIASFYLLFLSLGLTESLSDAAFSVCSVLCIYFQTQITKSTRKAQNTY